MKKTMTCKLCGGPISQTAVRGTGLCKQCFAKEARRKRDAAWNRKCVWCGGPIAFTHNKNVKTCSRHCQMLYVQSRRKETKEHLENRLIEYMKKQDHYVKLEELRKVLHISDHLLYSRGISCKELNYRAGKLEYLPDKEKTKEEIELELADILRKNPSIKPNEAGKILHVSAKRLKKMGIKLIDVRKRFNILLKTQSTKEDVESRVVSWLRTQPCYRNALDVCAALHIDYKCSIQNKGLDIIEMNRAAGHERPSTSYFEERTAIELTNNGIEFERQKTFDGCRAKKRLRFDFWLPTYNTLIEIQGLQHYNEKYYNYREMQAHDQTKKDYAATNNITLYCLDVAPTRTFSNRLATLLDEIKGSTVVTQPMHTASNCEKVLPDNAEDNPQPSMYQSEFGF